MVESYRVQAALILTSNVAAVLATAGRSLGAFDTRLRDMERRLDRLMGRMGTNFSDATRNMDAAGRATEGFARSTDRAAEAGRRQAGAMNESARAARGYSQELAVIEQRLARVGSASGGGGVPTYAPRMLGYSGGGGGGGLAAGLGAGGLLALAGRGGGGGGRGAGGGGSVPLLTGPSSGMNGYWAAGMAAMGRRGGGGGVPPGGGGGGGSGGGGGLAGAAVLGGLGAGMVGLAGGAVNRGGELQHQRTMLRAAGLSPDDVNAATATAWATTQSARGSRVAANLDLYAALRGTFTNEEARTYLPNFSRFNQVIGAATGRDPGRMGEMAARYLDQRDSFQNPVTGAMDPVRGLRELDLMQRVIVATQGRVNSEQYLNFQQTAGVAGKRINEGALFGTMPSLIESMGGFRAGTALAAASRQIVAGTMTQRVAEEMQRYGLIEPGAAQVRRGGQVVLRPGGVRGSTDFAHDPFAWVQNVLRPALVARGATTNDQQLEVVARLFGTETARRFISEMLSSPQAILRNQGVIHGVRADAGGVINEESWRTERAAFTGAWDSLLTAFGNAAMPNAVAMMRAVGGAMNGLAEWATANPNIAGALVEVVAALGGLAVGMAVFAVGGLVLSGMAAMGGAVGLLALIGAGLALLWQAVDGKDWTEKLATITGFFQGIWNLISQGTTAPSGAPVPQGRQNGLQWAPLPFDSSNPRGIPQNFSPSPDAGAGGGATPIVLHLDGRRVGEGLMPHLERQLNRPMESSARFDTGRALPGMDQI